ncbi:MAG: TetR/AcrR family transcriptional regulator [Janibacter sp.]
MSSVRDDRTARARVRDAALELFAEHGEDRVTMRQVADLAGVSPALVVHHFGSKTGLREAVVEHVRTWLDDLIDRSGQTEAGGDLASGDWNFIADLVAPAFNGPGGGAMARYLRRLMLSGDPVATELLRGWLDRTTEVMQAWDAAGYFDAGPDPRLRAAVLMSADFGLFFLVEQWRELLGIDPLGEGMDQWAQESMKVYSAIFSASDTPTDSAIASTPPSPEETP